MSMGAGMERYARHLSLPGIGEDGQRKLLNSSVLVIGAGGLGSPILLYLAAAGVGKLSILDADVVETSNLQRQVIHGEETAGTAKVESAAARVSDLNSGIDVRIINEFLTPENALRLFAEHDVVLDGSDNFATRYLSTDAAEITGTPLVWGTIAQFDGQMSVFWPGKGPMLRDLFPDIPSPDSVPSCAAGGVLGALPGMLGSMMAIEAIKVITGVGEPSIGKLIMVDTLNMSMKTLRFGRDTERPAVTQLPGDTIEACATSAPVRTVSAQELAEQDALIVDVREASERDEFGTIPGDVHVPLAEIERDGWSAVGRPAEQAVVYCHAGTRSAQAVRRLQADENSPELRSLSGGILAWNALQK